MKIKKVEPIIWECLTINEMRKVLKKTKTAILPLGVTEQHGYHLPLCTDTCIAYETAKRVSIQTGAIVAPPLPYSFSGGELTGTINVSPQVTALMLQEIIKSIIQNGFKNIVMILGHGGSENFMAIKDSLNLFLRSNSHLTDVVLSLAPVWEFGTAFKKGFREGDFHGGYVATSIIMYYRPDLVRKKIVMDKPAIAQLQRDNPDNYQLIETLVDSPHVVRKVSQRPDIKVGIMGYPERSTVEYGEKAATDIINGISDLIRQIETKKYKSYREVKIKRGNLIIA